MKKHPLVIALCLANLLSATLSYSAVPQPQSEGKFFPGKGTKAAESYEATAGTPTYDYTQGLQWGALHLRPFIDYGFHWNDNVFLEEDHTKDDIINSLSAGANVELPLGGGQHLLSGGYRVYQEWFDQFDDQDHTDHQGNVGLKLNFVSFTLDLNDILERTVSRADTEFTDRVKRDENAFHSLLEVPFASFFLENEITDFNVSYDRGTDEIFNHNLLTVYQRIGYDMTPTRQLLVEYAFINVDYDQDTLGERDGDGHQFMLGMRGNFTERIAYQIWGGAQDRVYDDDARPDFGDFVFRTALQWDPSETNRIMLRADRTPQESTFDNQSFYTRNRVELSWRRQLAEQWFFNSHAMAAFHEYSRITVIPLPINESKTREDVHWDAGAGLEYLMPNDIVSITLDYRFGSRDSNISGLDYLANEVMAGVRASF